MSERVKICHLYPDLMNLYGDRGNVLALWRRCLWHGLEVAVTPAFLGDEPDFGSFDIVFLGGGQDREQKLICDDLVHRKGESLRRAALDGVVILGICGGYQLLGRYYRTAAGEVIPGVGVLDLYTEAGPRRLIGNVVVKSPLGATGDGDACARTLVGFENHSGKTRLGPGARPLGRVVVGNGNNGEDGTEGAVHLNVVGTYLHGSLLPKNPWLADFLISRAMERRGVSGRLLRLDDALEERAHQAAIRRACGGRRA